MSRGKTLKNIFPAVIELQHYQLKQHTSGDPLPSEVFFSWKFGCG